MRVLVVTKAEDIPKKMVDDKPTIVYWNIVGLVGPIRLALVYANVDHVDVRIEAGPMGPDYRKDWLTAKNDLEQTVLDFPNLPYYFDDDVQLTQTNAILRYIGRKYNLMGVPGQEHVVDLILGDIHDREIDISSRAYPKGGEAVLAWYTNDVPKHVQRLSKFCGDKEFVTGNIVSVADFKLYSWLAKLPVIQADLQGPDVLNDILRTYMKRMEALLHISDYITSSDYQKSPLNNPSAKWRG